MSHFTNEFNSLSPLVLTSQEPEQSSHESNSMPITMHKFDPNDTELNSLMDNNRRWAAAVVKEDPEFFSNIATKQEPKLLWIGKLISCISILIVYLVPYTFFFFV